jgi:hypothetical protein
LILSQEDYKVGKENQSVTGYLPLPNKCDPHACFMAIPWMLIECGYSKEVEVINSRSGLDLQSKELFATRNFTPSEALS